MIWTRKNHGQRARAGTANRRILRWLVFLCAAFAVFRLPSGVPAAAEGPAIVLHTHDEEISGEAQKINPAVETIRCIMDRLGRRVEIRRAPRQRNKGMLKAGHIDGMFPNLPDEELDWIGTATEPFVLERWSYVQRRDSRNPARPRGHTVGVVLGSNESRFLRDHGVNIFDAIPNMESLVRLLAARRVPYGMADDWSFGAEAELLGYPKDAFRSAILRYVPLQAYFSKPFIEANPDFVSRFNETIKDCVHEGRQVAVWEREILRMEVDAILADDRGEMLEHVKAYQTVSGLDPLLSRIESLTKADEEWRAALIADRMSVLMEAILANPLSAKLRRIAAEHPTITEIFVVNRDGYVVGLNRLTSDYWQGDEPAAEAVLGKGEARHFSAFEYDLSTRRFQVQVSLPLYEAGAGSDPVGMVTVGIDAAGVLAGRMH